MIRTLEQIFGIKSDAPIAIDSINFDGPTSLLNLPIIRGNQKYVVQVAMPHELVADILQPKTQKVAKTIPVKKTTKKKKQTHTSEADMDLKKLISSEESKPAKKTRRIKCKKTGELISCDQYKKNKAEGMYDNLSN